MSPEAQSVLNFILENPGMKNRAIASAMNIPMGTVNAIVVKLRKDGHLKPAVTDLESPSYGRCWPVEPQCPDTAVDASIVASPSSSGSTTSGTGIVSSGGKGASVVPASPSDSDATPIVQMESVGVSPSGVSPSDWSGRPLRWRESSDSPIPTPEVQAALQAAKELAEENARLRLRLSHIRAHRNELESELSHISWLCESAGFTGSGDTLDQLCWLLDHLGHPNFARAIPARRSALRKIQEGKEALRNLQMQVRLDLPRETDDRCRCGREATKVEGEEGFTQCDPCFHREGGE